MIMGEKSAEEIANEFNDSDLFRFKWRILKYMCQMCEKYGTFLETELFFRADLKGYIDEKYGRDYLHGKSASLYKLLMDRIMNCLIDRDVVEVSGSYPYGYSEMSVYKTNQRLKDKCGEFEKYEMGDASLLDKHLPKIR
jgi:hypothetical protein